MKINNRPSQSAVGQYPKILFYAHVEVVISLRQKLEKKNEETANDNDDDTKVQSVFFVKKKSFTRIKI